MSEEEDDDLYFDFEDKSVPDVDPMRIAKMEITAKGLDENPQTLVELAGDIPNLKILAEHIGVLMSAPGIVAYSADARQQLEFSFRVFCSTLLKDQAKKQAPAQPSAPVENTDKINLLTKKLFEAEKNLALLKNQYAKVERDNNNLRIENENLQKEVEQHFEERQNLLNKITLMRRQEDANLSSLKQEVDDTNNEMQNVRGKLLQTEFSVKRLQEQLDAANEENTQLSTENIDLKSKLESKSDKVDSLKSDLSNMKVSCESLEAEKNVLLTENSNM